MSGETLLPLSSVVPLSVVLCCSPRLVVFFSCQAVCLFLSICVCVSLSVCAFLCVCVSLSLLECAFWRWHGLLRLLTACACFPSLHLRLVVLRGSCSVVSQTNFKNNFLLFFFTLKGNITYAQKLNAHLSGVFHHLEAAAVELSRTANQSAVEWIALTVALWELESCLGPLIRGFPQLLLFSRHALYRVSHQTLNCQLFILFLLQYLSSVSEIFHTPLHEYIWTKLVSLLK